MKKETTETAEGNIEYWYCRICSGFFKDENDQTGISRELVVIPVKAAQAGSAASPQTGDGSSIALWLAIPLAAGAALACVLLYVRRKKSSK